MGRRKSPPVAASAYEIKTEVDDIIGAWATQQRLTRGVNKVLIGNEAAATCVGLYLPHLILRYFFQSNVLPLGRMMMIAGEHMSGKSTFLYWLYKLFRQNDGGWIHIENETKDSKARRLAVLEWDTKNSVTYESEYLEDWQEYTINAFAETGKAGEPTLKELMTAAGKAGRMPFIVGVDSFTAKASRAAAENLVEAGHAEKCRDQQDAAANISRFLKVVPTLFGNWPVFYVGTNHLKKGQEQVGAFVRQVNNVGGGMALKFMETFEIHMQREKDISRLHEEGTRYRMRTEKNSIGKDDKTIEVDVITWTDREKDSSFYGKQLTRFQWDQASIELILGKNGGFSFMKDRKTIQKELQEITGIKEATNGKCYSDILGVPSGDPISYSDMGTLLEEAPDAVIKEVHMVLNIAENAVFTPTSTYQAQIDAVRNESMLGTKKEEIQSGGTESLAEV